MLEALISIRRQGETDLKKRGDILVVKLAGAPWGDEEKKIHQVVEWEEAALEQRLVESQSSDNPIPLMVHPYAEFQERQVMDGEGKPVTDPDSKEAMTEQVMVSRSSERVDIDALSDAVKANVLDVSVEQPMLRASDYERRTVAVPAS